MSARPKLPRVDPEMRRWCAVIEEELSTWRDITTRPMFGLTGYYRAGVMFAAIPRTRAVDTPYSLLVKTTTPAAGRLRSGQVPGAGWTTFEMRSEADLTEALRHLARAYDRSRKSR